MIVDMAEHVFESALVEEFYNSCHLKSNGKFCGKATRSRGTRVPMSDAARASNAAIRGQSAKRRKTEKSALEKARNKTTANKDGSEPIKGGFKLTGNKSRDAVALTRLDRGSKERKAAATAFEKRYGGK